jgi:hypothetical protein
LLSDFGFTVLSNNLKGHEGHTKSTGESVLVSEADARKMCISDPYRRASLTRGLLADGFTILGHFWLLRSAVTHLEQLSVKNTGETGPRLFYICSPGSITRSATLTIGWASHRPSSLDPCRSGGIAFCRH